MSYLPDFTRVSTENHEIAGNECTFPVFGSFRDLKDRSLLCDSSDAARGVAVAAVSGGRLRPDRHCGGWGCGEGGRQPDQRWQGGSLYRSAPGRDDPMAWSENSWEKPMEKL